MNEIISLWAYARCCFHHANTRHDRTDSEAGQSVEHVLWYVLGAAAVILIAGVVYNSIRNEANKGIPGH